MPIVFHLLLLLIIIITIIFFCKYVVHSKNMNYEFFNENRIMYTFKIVINILNQLGYYPYVILKLFIIIIIITMTAAASWAMWPVSEF